jgi:hypothetical protein
MVYVISGAYSDAVLWAHRAGVARSDLRYIKDRKDLRGLKPKEVFLVGQYRLSDAYGSEEMFRLQERGTKFIERGL